MALRTHFNQSEIGCPGVAEFTVQRTKALFDNTAVAMGDAPDFIKYRHIRNCHRCDPAYGEGVAKALGLTVEDAQAARATDPALGQPGLL